MGAMFSLFSMFRHRTDPPLVITAKATNNNITSDFVPRSRLITMHHSAPSIAQVLTNMLDALRVYLPAAAPPLPDPGISVVNVKERSVGIGNWRGIEQRGAIGEIALKGGRLDAVARFQLWGASVGDVDSMVDTLHSDLLDNATSLWNDGFLRLDLNDSAPAEFIGGTTNAWRRTSEVKVLYEYHYQDLDGAESLIARIPIYTDPEEADSPERETTIVSDELVRWDNLQAGQLVVSATARTPVRVFGLASLAYRPAAWSGNTVTLARLQRTNTDPPTAYPSLADFLSAVSDGAAPDRHAQVVFSSLDDFLAAFDSAGDPIELGDWDEDGVMDSYEPGVIRFDSPITLHNSNDTLSVTYQDSAFDTQAVVYLRIGVGGW
jgi:hypothetical protein